MRDSPYAYYTIWHKCGCQVFTCNREKMAYTKEQKMNKSPRKLEDCQPGATKSEVFEALRIVALTKKGVAKKNNEPPSQA